MDRKTLNWWLTLLANLGVLGVSAGESPGLVALGRSLSLQNIAKVGRTSPKPECND